MGARPWGVGEQVREGVAVMAERGGTGAGLDLADAITLLRGQLTEAQSNLVRDGDRGIVLTVGDITLELEVELTHTRAGDASVRFGVVGAGGKRERGDKSVHKVTVQLKAGTPTGPLNINDTDD